jgi:hypothetical protein
MKILFFLGDPGDLGERFLASPLSLTCADHRSGTQSAGSQRSGRETGNDSRQDRQEEFGEQFL